MLLVPSLGCGFMSGMASGYLSLSRTLDDYLEDMQYPDAIIETTVVTRDIAEKVAEVPGVKAVDTRLAGNLLMVGSTGTYYQSSRHQGYHGRCG